VKKLIPLLAALVVIPAAGATGKPSVSFVTPKAMATTGSTVTFKVRLANFALDAKDVGKTKKAGLGHLHFAMDRGKFDYPRYSGPNGTLAKQLGIAGAYSPAVTPTIR
jgi:hypothetical protein